jgi:hypothetical protein
MSKTTKVKTTKTKKKPEIKRCPFCGSNGLVYRWGMSLYWSAECSGSLLPPDKSCGCGWKNWFKTEEDAIKTWNNRVEI